MRALTAALPLILLGAGAQAQDWTTISVGTSANLTAIEKTSFSQRSVGGASGFVVAIGDYRPILTASMPKVFRLLLT